MLPGDVCFIGIGQGAGINNDTIVAVGHTGEDITAVGIGCCCGNFSTIVKQTHGYTGNPGCIIQIAVTIVVVPDMTIDGVGYGVAVIDVGYVVCPANGHRIGCLIITGGATIGTGHIGVACLGVAGGESCGVNGRVIISIQQAGKGIVASRVSDGCGYGITAATGANIAKVDSNASNTGFVPILHAVSEVSVSTVVIPDHAADGTGGF